MTPTQTNGELSTEVAAVQAAIQAAVNDAIEQHRQRDLPMATWRDGQVVWIPASELPTASGH